jgi:beta-N-acetylglucosaminidase
MRKISYFVFFVFSFVIFSFSVSAEKIIVVTEDYVNFRSAPTTGSSVITMFNSGQQLSLISDNAGTGNGCTLWYKASNNGTVGYICSEFTKIEEIPEINMADYEEYSDYLKALGFPDSYIPYLVTLHVKYPTWSFKVYDIKQDFNSMVTKEYDGYSQGWSLIEDTNRSRDGYKSTASWSYNYLTDTFSNDFRGGGTYWFAANKATIAYYMDPRNFLNERQVFMYEALSYNSNYHTAEGVTKMLNGTFMQGYADSDNKKTYVDAFLDAATEYNISPYVLISRVIQEVGAQGSTIVSGTVAGYEGYYNFYNIKASGNGSAETIANGLKHAKEQGWNTHYKAIVGGASFLANDYVSVGQDTLYLQKWDMVGNSLVNHQYMQNIEAPANESVKTYRAYSNVNMLNSDFVFSIPVYKNMPEKVSLPNIGNPNNFLSSLSVNGSYLFQKASSKTKYDLNLDASTKTVEIAASKVSNRSTVSGTGSISLENDQEEISIVVTAENGDKRTYVLTIKRNAVEEALDIAEILRVLGIKNDGTYVYGYKTGTDAAAIIKSITDKEPKATVTYKNKDGELKNNGIIATGDVINIKTSREEKTYTLIIYGDVNGDGLISSVDYIAIKNHIMGTKKLSGVSVQSADANKSGDISSADYIAIKNHIMGTKLIVQ